MNVAEIYVICSSRAIVASSLGGAFRLWPITNPANGIINNDEVQKFIEEVLATRPLLRDISRA